ncbi:MAG: ferritin-like domain-containing protein [Leptolyngbya sp. Prado105]|jgi:rubrerythrin|nr:ferritin-like domain-containing protein [Leptolyngbya sp. Prado105]
MNLVTQLLHIVSSGASAYIFSNGMRDRQTRPNLLAGFQMAESGSVPFLQALRDRANAEGETGLAEKLDRHANEEKRHGQIFAHGLKQLNKKVINFGQRVEKEIDRRPDESKRSPFFDAYFVGYSQAQLTPENIPWEVFLASTYILELDASKDFVRMAEALPDDPISANLRQGILSIAADETGHAAYLYEAMHSQFGSAKTQELVDQWRTRKVNAMLAAVQSFITKGGKMGQMVEEGAPIEMPTQDPVAA